ncbi:MAG: SPASM domain-containing protein, partial [Bdellovibrionales bacterium]|nr:SPASM domain-containing protein [Bdellovibrionales bacterium]
SKVFRQINFSLHSFFDNFPDRDPTLYLEKIFEFTDRALKARPDLYLNFRLWNLEATDRAGEKNREMLKRIQARYPFQMPEIVNVKKDKSIKIQGRLYLHLDTEFVWPSPTADFVGEAGTCRALQNHFGILVDGTVVPCCLDSEGRIPLGSAKEKPIQDILLGAEARKILDGFRQKKLVNPLCQRCNYATRFKSVRPIPESSDLPSRSPS